MGNFGSNDYSVEGDQAAKTGNYIIKNYCVESIDLIPIEKPKDHEDHRSRQYAKKQIDQRFVFL
jgi:hypothetical protein